MKHKNRWLFYILCIILLLLAATPVTFANSAEPPGLTVIVPFPADDLMLSLRFADALVADAVQLRREQKAWESYYRFFYGMTGTLRPSLTGAILIAHSDETYLEIPLPASVFDEYNNLITLDMAHSRIIEGQSVSRSIVLISMRVVLTLLIEGALFYMFGYRNRVSWVLFLIVNVLTQGALNILLSGPNLGSYWLFGFLVVEFLIFTLETIAFAIGLSEHRKRRAIVYALTANAASLLLGGMMIAYLPV